MHRAPKSRLLPAETTMRVPEFGEKLPGREYIVRPGVYGLIFDSEGRVAVVQTPRGCFLPGGGREPAETPQQTLRREVREECGWEIEVGCIVGEAIQYVFSAYEEQGFEKRCVFLEAFITDHGVAACEDDHRVVWMTPAEAVAELAHASQAWVVRRHLKGHVHAGR